MVDPSAIIHTGSLLLSITDKLLDKLPNYEQAKKKKYYKLRKRYLEELNADYKYRDDQLLDELWEEIILFLSVFNQEITEKKNE